MGVKNLIPLVKKHAPYAYYPIDLASFRGKKLAVDGTLLFYRFWRTNPCKKYVLFKTKEFISMLSYYEIQAIFVFDGKNRSKAKDIAKLKRNEVREIGEQRLLIAQRIKEGFTNEFNPDVLRHKTLSSSPSSSPSSSSSSSSHSLELSNVSQTLDLNEKKSIIKKVETLSLIDKEPMKHETLNKEAIPISTDKPPSENPPTYIAPKLKTLVFKLLSPLLSIFKSSNSSSPPSTSSSSTSESTSTPTSTPISSSSIVKETLITTSVPTSESTSSYSTTLPSSSSPISTPLPLISSLDAPTSQPSSSTLPTATTNTTTPTPELSIPISQSIDPSLLTVGPKSKLGRIVAKYDSLTDPKLISEVDKEIQRLQRTLEPVSKATLLKLRWFLYHHGIPSFLAQDQCEAEQMCAALVRYGFSDAVMTEDTDAIVFYRVPVLCKWNGTSSFYLVHPKLVQELQFETDAAFIDLCILCGCDYSGKLHHVGEKTAFKLMRQFGSIEAILNQCASKYPPEPSFQPELARSIFNNQFLNPAYLVQQYKEAMDGIMYDENKEFLRKETESVLDLSEMEWKYTKDFTKKNSQTGRMKTEDEAIFSSISTSTSINETQTQKVKRKRRNPTSNITSIDPSNINSSQTLSESIEKHKIKKSDLSKNEKLEVEPTVLEKGLFSSSPLSPLPPPVVKKRFEIDGKLFGLNSLKAEILKVKINRT